MILRPVTLNIEKARFRPASSLGGNTTIPKSLIKCLDQMGSSVLADMVTLIRDHPYVSCSLLVFLTPPFWPILKYFSPLLISTALFLVALVTMGPQFEDPSEQEREFQGSPELNSEDEAGFREEDVTRDVKRTKSSKDIRSMIGDWVSSCKESGFMWVEQKLRNDNFRGASLNDENVSILQEAFAHRAEEKPRLMVKLVTRRIPAEESFAEEHNLQRQGVPELSNSGSWNSFHAPSGRSFETAPSFTAVTKSRDLPHDFFSPHPSLSRRLDSDTSMFDNVEPPPIEHDMPPQITGPASVTDPLLKYIDDASDSDEYDHHHSDHDEDMHLEFGERSLDAESISQDELSLANGTYGQPPPFTVQEEDLPSSSGSDEGRHYFADLHQGDGEMESPLPTRHDEAHDRDIDLHDQQAVDAVGTHGDTATHVDDVPEELTPPVEIPHEDHSVPAQAINDESHPPETPAHEDMPQVNDDTELHDIPELEDVIPVENEIHEPPAAVEEDSGAVPGDPHTDVILGDVPSSHEEPHEESHEEPHEPEVATDHPPTDDEEPHKEPETPAAPTDVHLEPHHFVERSMSLPVAGSLATAESIESATAHEDHAQLDRPLPEFSEPVNQTRTLGNAISLPAGSNPIQPLIIPLKTADQGPRSPDTDLGYATTPDHERRGLAGRFFAAERYNSITSMSGDESEFAEPELSTKEKLVSKLEVLCNSMPSPSNCGELSNRRPADVSILRATTDEQVTHVSDKLRGYIGDSPSKKFQPDAPQLQITPPSTKVTLNGPPSKSAILASALGRPSIRPVASTTRKYAQYKSSEDSSEDETDLDSDPEGGGGSESESDFESHSAGVRLKPPPKPPAEILTPQPVVQGKKTDAEPVKK